MDDSASIPTSSGIYRITCTTTGLFYVGSAVNLYRRWITHFSDLHRNKHRNPKLQRAFNKHGADTFIFEVLELVLIPEMLTTREQYWFDTLKPFGERGFNIAPIAGSTLGRKASPETIEKNRLAHLGQIPANRGKKHTPEARAKMKASSARRGKPGINLGKKMSPETIEKLRSSHIGKPGYWTGKKRPPETIKKLSAESRAKISNALRNRSPSPETREKLRLANLGKKPSEEARQRMRDAHAKRRGIPRDPEIGRKISLAKLGHPVSDETRAKLIANHRGVMKTLIVTSPDGVEYSVIGVRQFCKEHNLDRRSIQRVAQGKYSQYKGWKARYAD